MDPVADSRFSISTTVGRVMSELSTPKVGARMVSQETKMNQF